MIELKNLTKTYQESPIIFKLNSKVEKGTIYGLVGANGAGKSTLLRLIAGIVGPDEGQIIIEKENILHSEKIKQKVVYIPDELYTFQGYTILEHAKVYKALYTNFSLKKFKHLVKTFKLDLNTKINSLSKGSQKCLAIICALSTNCEYILLDETFDGLDPVIRKKLKEILINQNKEKNTTIIITSHNLRELEEICKSVGILHQGGIILENNLDKIKTKMFKIQIALKEFPTQTLFKELDLISYEKSGSISTIIAQGNKEEIKTILNKQNPIILDFLPLTLEEIFIYEMEANGYEFSKMA